jgi:hypothetical protein
MSKRWARPIFIDDDLQFEMRRPWWWLTGAERLRVVAEGGGSCLLALQADEAPLVDWATVFRRTSHRIRDRFEPRFPVPMSPRPPRRHPAGRSSRSSGESASATRPSS